MQDTARISKRDRRWRSLCSTQIKTGTTGKQAFSSLETARSLAVADARLAAKLYKKRFSAYARWLHGLGRTVGYGDAPPFFMFVPKSLKLLHEEVLGEETFRNDLVVTRMKTA